MVIPASFRCLLFGSGLLVVACLRPSEPEVVQPLPLPDQWQASEGAGDADPDGWVRQVGSARLKFLVEEALVHNRDLRATAARLEASRYDTIANLARVGPSVGFDGRVNRRAGESRPGTLASQMSYSSSLDIGWEPDLWGRLRRQNRADHKDFVATAWDHRGAQLSVAARTAQAWFNLITARRQLDLAREQLGSFEDDLAIISRSFDLGLDTAAADLRLAENQVEQARSRIAATEQTLGESRRALEVLLGRYPAAEIDSAGTLPPLSGSLPSLLPVDLLGRRPDLVAARLNAEAQLDRAEAARLNWLPSVNLSASAGRTSSRIADLFDLPNLTREIGAGLAQPIFDSGRLAGERGAAGANARAAVEDYAETLLQAMIEVENALDAEVFLSRQLAAEERAAGRAREALELARENYAQGLAETSVLFEAQRRVIDSESSVLDLQNRRWQNRIDLYLALGGGV